MARARTSLGTLHNLKQCGYRRRSAQAAPRFGSERIGRHCAMPHRNVGVANRRARIEHGLALLNRNHLALEVLPSSPVKKDKQHMKNSLLVAALVALAVSACGKKETAAPAPAPATQEQAAPAAAAPAAEQAKEAAEKATEAAKESAAAATEAAKQSAAATVEAAKEGASAAADA